MTNGIPVVLVRGVEKQEKENRAASETVAKKTRPRRAYGRTKTLSFLDALT